MSRVTRSVKYRVGRRGAFLSFLALLDVLYGWSQLTDPLASLSRFDTFMPASAWAWAWIGVGVICAVHAPVAHDAPGFAGAALLKTAWAVLFTQMWLVQGFPRGWVSAAVWASFAAIVVMVSGWPEPRSRT